MKSQNQISQYRPNGTLRVATVNEEPTMAQQQFKDECDINNIMKKYSTTGQFTHLTSKTGIYADFSQITDYQDMLHTVQYAQDAFASLPADVRLRFSNDPGKLLEFIQDSKNYDEGVKLGLVNPKIQPPPSQSNEQTQTNDINEGTKPKTSKKES